MSKDHLDEGTNPRRKYDYRSGKTTFPAAEENLVAQFMKKNPTKVHRLATTDTGARNIKINTKVVNEVTTDENGKVKIKISIPALSPLIQMTLRKQVQDAPAAKKAREQAERMRIRRERSRAIHAAANDTNGNN